MEARLPAAARLSQLTSENCNVGEIRLNFSFNYKTAGMCCTHVQMICRETNMPKQLQTHIQLHVFLCKTVLYINTSFVKLWTHLHRNTILFYRKYFSCKWDIATPLQILECIFHVLIKGLAGSISASFKVLKSININKCKPTVFSLLFLHYEWHHITLGCRVMIRGQ